MCVLHRSHRMVTEGHDIPLTKKKGRVDRSESWEDMNLTRTQYTSIFPINEA